jgi:hypothetical protein
MIIKPAVSAYVTLGIIFGIPTLIPFFMGLEQYISSSFWVAHIPMIFILIFWTLFMYSQVEITEKCFKIGRFSLTGIKNNVVNFDEITSWKDTNPIFLYTKDKDYQLLWGLFSIKDCTLIRKKIESLNIKSIE